MYMLYNDNNSNNNNTTTNNNDNNFPDCLKQPQSTSAGE